MRNKALLVSSILLVSSAAFAEQGLLESVAKQVVKDTATTAAPAVVDKVEAANQSLEKAKNLKDKVENAPEAIKNQVKDTATKKLNEAVPAAAKKATATAGNLKQKVKSVPKSTNALKSKVKAKAAEKVLDLLH
jgi:hypothetical protein